MNDVQLSWANRFSVVLEDVKNDLSYFIGSEGFPQNEKLIGAKIIVPINSKIKLTWLRNWFARGGYIDVELKSDISLTTLRSTLENEFKKLNSIYENVRERDFQPENCKKFCLNKDCCKCRSGFGSTECVENFDFDDDYINEVILKR